MPKPNATPNFDFSLDALIQISGQKRSFIGRDATQFTAEVLFISTLFLS